MESRFSLSVVFEGSRVTPCTVPLSACAVLLVLNKEPQLHCFTFKMPSSEGGRSSRKRLTNFIQENEEKNVVRRALCLCGV